MKNSGVPTNTRDEPDGCSPKIFRASSREMAGETNAVSETLLEPGNGMGSASVEFMTVTTDQADYAPGSTATFAVTGVASGSSVAFRVADVPSDPGINGIADVYAPFSVTDGGPDDLDGLANGIVVAQWQVPTDGRATDATLQLSATSGNGTGLASLEFMTVTTDQADYAPGSTATFT